MIPFSSIGNPELIYNRCAGEATLNFSYTAKDDGMIVITMGGRTFSNSSGVNKNSATVQPFNHYGYGQGIELKNYAFKCTKGDVIFAQVVCTQSMGCTILSSVFIPF